MSTDILSATIEETNAAPMVTDANGYEVGEPGLPQLPADGGEAGSPDVWQTDDDIPPHLRELADDVHRAKAAWIDAKDAAKAAKDVYEAALDSLIDAMNPPGADGSGSTMEPVCHDDWRNVPAKYLARYGLTPGVLKSLAESGLTTLGGIADWGASGKQFSDLPGIGRAKADAIERATDAYYKEHPPADEPPPAESSDTETVA